MSEEEAYRTTERDGYYVMCRCCPMLQLDDTPRPLSGRVLVGRHRGRQATGLRELLAGRLRRGAAGRRRQPWLAVKVMTVVGTRPELIRLSLVFPQLDAAAASTASSTPGQNYDPRLSRRLLRGARAARAGRLPRHPAPTGRRADRRRSSPQRGASVLASSARTRCSSSATRTAASRPSSAARNDIPVFHMEAGNRCFDDRVPEEKNRRVIDHASDVLLPYTLRSRRTSFARASSASASSSPATRSTRCSRTTRRRSSAATRSHASACGTRRYFLVTMHRAENVDDPERLARLVERGGGVSSEHGLPGALQRPPAHGATG